MLRVMLHDGKDPQAEKQITRTRNLETPTVEELVNLYIDLYAKPNKRSWRNDQHSLQNYFVSKYGRVKAKHISRQHITILLDELIANGMGAGANRVFAAIRKMFNWAISKGILTDTPCAHIKAPAKEKSRDRILNHGEIDKFWNNMPATTLKRQYQLAFMLLLVTAQRKSEVLKMTKEELDLDNGWWVIPSERSKNGLQHRVPLSLLAKELIEEAIEFSQESILVFPSITNSEIPINGDTLSHVLAANRNSLEVYDFTIHDLRRTAASQMASSGITRLVISKILNHAESHITAVYDRHSYDQEKRIAIDKWANELLRIVENKNSSVIKFPSLG